MKRGGARVFRFPEQNDGAIGKEKITNRLFSHMDEIASSSEYQLDGGDNMDHDKLLEKYIDTVDKDRREMEVRLTDNSRESEVRFKEEISKKEELFLKQMDSYTSEAVEREKRFREDSKVREERVANSLEKLENKMESHSGSMENMKNQNFWGNIALFVGMLAIVITLILIT